MAAETSSELRQLAREHPEDFESVAEKIGGRVGKNLRRILDEERGDGAG